MNNIFLSFGVSLIAGLSTVIGTLFTYFKPKDINKFIGVTLSFSATIMILISVVELIPEGFFYLKIKYNLFYAVLAIIIMIFIGLCINTLINKKIVKRVGECSNLYRVGLLSMIALMIHNLPEGVLTFLSTSVDLKLGLKLGLAIMLHNIPEGIAIATPIFYSTYSHKKGIVGALISGLSEPLGALLAYLFLYKFINNTLISFILLFVAGIMISISINDIFEEAGKYSKKSLLIGALLGFIIFFLTFIVV